MEHIEAMAEGEWSSFSGIFSTEENDFMAQLLGNYSIPNEQELGSILSLGMPSEIWSGREAAMIKATGGDESSYYCSDTVNPSLICYPQSSSYSSGSSGLYYLSNSSPILMSNSCSMSMDLSMVHEQNNNSSVQIFAENPMEEGACFNEEMSSDQSGASPEGLHGKKLHLLKRKLEMPESDTNAEDKFDTNPSEYPRKKSRVPRDVQRKKNVQSKKNQKLNLSSNDEEEINANTNGQSSSSTDCSEDDSNGGGATTSGSKGSVALNLNGKTRASRGSATDPQSLYARKRRERINERLRILQNLVPNGTKVDISTMLEEAVEYVKFLQLQIKLLSSDDMWMYAPIAYNGMDIGLDLKISNSR